MVRALLLLALFGVAADAQVPPSAAVETKVVLVGRYLTWDEAQANCQKKGGHLVTIKSAEQSMELWNKYGAPPHNRSYWIGFNDRRDEGTWQWVSGQNQNAYTNWGDNQPDNWKGKEPAALHQDCAMVGLTWFSPDYAKLNVWKDKWDDTDCKRTKMPSLCDVPVDPKKKMPSPPPVTPEKLNVYMNQVPLSWRDAQAHCLSLGGNLVTLTSSARSMELYNKFGKASKLAFWIGLNDLQSEGKWAWVSGDKSHWRNWHVGEPDTHSGKDEDCAYVGNQYAWPEYAKEADWLDHWADGLCDTPMASLCETPNRIPGGMGGFPVFNTPGKQSAKILGHTIVLNERALTWQDAEAHCATIHGHLVTIYNQDFSTKLWQTFGQDRAYWIGYNDINVEGRWHWVSGAKPKSKFKRWGKNEPNSNNRKGQKNKGNEDCAYVGNYQLFPQWMSKSDWQDKWADGPCKRFKLQSLCEISIKTVCPGAKKNPNAPAPVSGDLPPSITVGSKTIQYVPQRQSWDDAQMTCMAMGGNLVSITSASMNTAIYNGFLSAQRTVWIGLNDKYQENKWVWASGSTTGFRKWHPGEPNSWKGKDQDCATLYTNFLSGSLKASDWQDQWDDQICTMKLPALCEVDNGSGGSSSAPASQVVAGGPAGKKDEASGFGTPFLVGVFVVLGVQAVGFVGYRHWQKKREGKIRSGLASLDGASMMGISGATGEEGGVGL